MVDVKERPRWKFQRDNPAVMEAAAYARKVRRDQEENAARAAARVLETQGCVYFIGCATGPIKIGHGRNVEYRLSNLQMGNPNQLTLLTWFPCDNAAQLEAELHERFAAHRLRGEWFAPAPELLELVRSIHRKRANVVCNVLGL